jgi:uncharacterized repeat protein (TIGR03899 family)
MEDMLGFGKGTEKLIDVISRACGVIYRPIAERKAADAEEYKIRLVSNAKADAKAHEIISLAKAKQQAKIFEDEMKSTLLERARLRAEHQQALKQHNLECAIQFAASHIKQEVSDENVDQDWIDTWAEHAQHVSAEVMQEIWGRVLAGEVAKPGSYSIKALATLRSMSRQEAEALGVACSLAGRHGQNGGRFIVHFVNMNSFPYYLSFKHREIDLQEHGLLVTDMLMLQSAGLIYTETLSSKELKRGDYRYLHYYDSQLKLYCKRGGPTFSMYRFTAVGDELADLVAAPKNAEYFDALKEALSIGFEIESV